MNQHPHEAPARKLPLRLRVRHALGLVVVALGAFLFCSQFISPTEADAHAATAVQRSGVPVP